MKFLVIWCLVAAVAAPIIGRYLEARRGQARFRAHRERSHQLQSETLTPAEKAAIEKSDARWIDQDDSDFANEVDQPRRSA